MDKVSLKKDELLQIVRENRAKHRAVFEEAQAGYRTFMIGELERMLADAREGRSIKRAVVAPEPVDQTKDYDRTIRMLELSVDDVVELEEERFSNLVMDEWRWQREWRMSNSNYVSSASNKAYLEGKRSEL